MGSSSREVWRVAGGRSIPMKAPMEAIPMDAMLGLVTIGTIDELSRQGDSPDVRFARRLRSLPQPYQPFPKGLSGRPAHHPFRDAMGRRRGIAHIVADVTRWRPPMQKPNNLNQSRIVLKQDSTLIAVIEMSLSSWLVADIVPGVERQPLMKLAVDESALLKLLNRWREEAEKAGCGIERITVAFEAGRDGFWLVRWL